VDAGRQEEWAGRNLTFFKNKYVLHPQWKTSMQQYRLGADWIGSGFAVRT